MSKSTLSQPISLLILAAIVAIEALVVAGYGVTYVIAIFAGESKLVSAMISLVVLFFAVAAFLVAATRGLLKHARWSRSAIVFWQTCQLAVAWGSFTGEGAATGFWIGSALILVSVAALGLAFSKPVLDRTRGDV